ncbi:MACPF domain-containing protein CAD1 [Linum perenne]
MSLSSDALTTTLHNSIQALGRGFDVTSDIRLLYCKGASRSRLVRIDEENTRNLVVGDGVLVASVDVECSMGKRSIDRIPVCSFHEVRFCFIPLDFFPNLCCVDGLRDGYLLICWCG